MKRARRSLACLAVPASLSACAVGPDYRRPEVSSAGGLPGPDAEPAGGKPWPTFPGGNSIGTRNSPELIRTALAQNLDLKLAVARVEEARATPRAANADFFPGVNGTLSTSPTPAQEASPWSRGPRRGRPI